MIHEWHKRWGWDRRDRGYRCSLEIREEVLLATKANRRGLVNRRKRFSLPLEDSLETFAEDSRR